MIVKPRFAAWTFLLYAGAATILSALIALLVYLGLQHGAAGFTLWSLLVFAVLAGGALLLRRSGGHPVAAGLIAFVAVWAAGAFLGSLFHWFGWLSHVSTSAFGGFHLDELALLLLTLVVALVALRLFHFPLLVLPSLLLAWLLVTSVVSNGGDWSDVVTLLVGLAYLGLGRTLDGDERRPYGFWAHVLAALLIGGSLLDFWHGGNVDWALVAVAGVLFVGVAELMRRASWAVVGAIGIVLAAIRFAVAASHTHVSLVSQRSDGARGWAPALVLVVAGVLLMGLGGLLARRAVARGEAGSRVSTPAP